MMDSSEFLRPRLRGPRFDDGGIPLEFFADLIALRRMVIEVAGWRYTQEYQRRRPPPGFANSVALNLVGVDRGSAVPVINLAPVQSGRNGAEPPQLRFFETARDDIVEAIAAAAHGEHAAAANSHLPHRFLSHFRQIGRSLRDGECMELQTSERAEPARLTPETRARLLQISAIPEPIPAIPELTQEITVRGAIAAADQDRMTFEFQPVYGRKISGPIPERHRAAIVAAFSGYRDQVRVLLRGAGRYDRQRRLAGIASVEHIIMLDPLDVPARLDEFRAMRDGWLDGEDGVAPSHAGLDWLASNFARHYPDDVPLPYAYPTPAGGVQLEWSLGVQAISLDVDLATRRAWWHRLDLVSEDDAEAELNLDAAADWKWLGAEIIRLEKLAE